MSDYSKTTNFTAKDALNTGDPAKLIKGSDMDTEFDAIAVASATKADKASPSFTGTVTVADGTNDLNVASHDGTNGLQLAGTLVTSTAAELNILDGVTATAAELNIMDAGATVTTPTVAGGDAFVMDDLDVGMVQVDIDNVDTYLAQTTKTLTNKTLTSPTITTPTLDLSGVTSSGDLAVADGGTGASTAAAARTNLGLVIDTDVQGVTADVSNYLTGQTQFLEDDTGTDTSYFDAAAVIGAAWESVGPTGSSATNIWTSLDSLPANTKWVEVRIFAYSLKAAASSYVYVFGRKTGSVVGATNATRLVSTFIQATGATTTAREDFTYAKIPLDASNRFDLYLSKDSTTTVAEVYLVGWGI